MRDRVQRWSGPLTLLGAALWLVSAYFGGQFGSGGGRILGFTEQDYRAFFNPALVLLLVGALSLWGRLWTESALRRAGSALIASGLLAALLGNWLEYGPFPPLSVAGWGIFLLGLLGFGPLGALAISVAEWRSPSLPGLARLGLLLLAIVPVALLGPGAIGLSEVGFAIAGPTFGLGWVLVGLSLAALQRAPAPALSTPTG